MNRLLAVAAMVLAAATGCRMCSSPYDYCGPVVEAPCLGGSSCGCNSGTHSVEGMPVDGAPVEGQEIENSPPMEGETVPPDSLPAPSAAPQSPTPAGPSSSYNSSASRKMNSGMNRQ